MYTTPIDPEDFRLPNTHREKPDNKTARQLKTSRQRRTDKFIRGPIPWWWITQAAQLGSKVPVVAYAIWFFVGVKKSDTVPLSTGFLGRELGVGRMSVYRALSRLEEAKLIRVKRQRGRNPQVEVIRTRPEDDTEITGDTRQ